MPEIRAIISLILRISFVVLIAVLMILWIVFGAQTVNEVNQLEAQYQKDRNNNKNIDKRTLDRVKGMTIFNTILEESIALLAIIGLVLNHRYLLHTSMVLLAIIWFVAHYRISDFLWTGSPVMISSHIIHFFVVSIGLSFTHFVKESEKSKEKGSKIADNSANGANGVTTTKAA